MKLFLRLFAVLSLLCLAAAAFVLWQAKLFLETAPATPGAEVLFDVEQGASFTRVARQLAERGLITDAQKFSWLARYREWDNKLQAGRFALHSGWTPDKTLHQLVNGRPVLSRITLREGLTWWEVGRLLEEEGFVKFEDFKEVIFDPQFLRHYGIPFASAEGFLMPDTYLLKKADTLPLAADVTPGPTTAGQETTSAAAPAADNAAARTAGRAIARAIAGRLVDTFWQKTAHLWPDGKKLVGADLRRLIILASIVEKETAIADERATVAGVYTNRLKKNMLLQADPTVIYGLGPSFNGNLRRTHLNDAANLYNSYQRPGLPPGPICSPGIAAIRAALHPERHNFLYFVAKTDGGEHSFSTNLDDHNKAVRRYLDNRKKK